MTKVVPFDPPCIAPTALHTVTQRQTNPLNVCLMVLTTMAFAYGIAFLVVHAQQIYGACYTISTPHLVLDSISISNFSLSSRQVSAEWDVRMNLESWVRRGYINLHDITISIFYEALQVGLTSLVPFDVSPRNSTVYFEKKFRGSSGLVDDSMIKAMNENIVAGTVKLHVQFKGSVRKSFKGRWVDHLELLVDCNNVELFFGSSDKSRAQMSNPSRKCRPVLLGNYDN
ncbi:hypothetical protein DCAR_0520919 [Daucus carota subsp. sativus]|uniref:Uncharacterized protein n=1 Tax=Daucus carota subsp. sativus TaxID=79200 RepID=A0A161YMT3_DAUCS|nr:PREDICTED: uncharacterized protein LOC108221623 [Daucus carota subsp. sativus]WOH01535.1 hypothetical protein DCAR_0520919 [Daucus carota subsp. sativus]